MKVIISIYYITRANRQVLFQRGHFCKKVGENATANREDG
jgi:hypothetical protein